MKQIVLSKKIKKKYEKLFNYLNEIKNDKVKLIEYFKNPTIF